MPVSTTMVARAEWLHVKHVAWANVVLPKEKIAHLEEGGMVKKKSKSCPFYVQQ